MSYTGKRPKVKTVRYEAQSTSPADLIEGDVFNPGSSHATLPEKLHIKNAAGDLRVVGRNQIEEFVLNGPYWVDGAQNEVLFIKLQEARKLLGVELTILKAGTGTVSVDLKYKRGAGSWTTILIAPISHDHSDGDYSGALGTISVSDFLAGDLIRLDLTGVPSSGAGLIVRCLFDQ